MLYLAREQLPPPGVGDAYLSGDPAAWKPATGRIRLVLRTEDASPVAATPGDAAAFAKDVYVAALPASLRQRWRVRFVV